MKYFSVVVLVVAACQARNLENSSVITLKDFHQQHKGDERIVQGNQATRGQFPYQVAIYMHTGQQAAFCGGSLISTEWVLTAAHCVTDVDYWTIEAGVYQLNIWNDPDLVSRNSSQGFYHEQYNRYLNNDIGLIKLPEPVQLSDTIQISRLPARRDINQLLTGITVTVSGWGKTGDNEGTSADLNYVQLQTISNAECAKEFGQRTIINSTICAVGHSHSSPCSGDSGGPMVFTDYDGQLTQCGIVSFVSRAGCEAGNAAGFVRTAHFLDWINKNTGIPIRN